MELHAGAQREAPLQAVIRDLPIDRQPRLKLSRGIHLDQCLDDLHALEKDTAEQRVRSLDVKGRDDLQTTRRRLLIARRLSGCLDGLRHAKTEHHERHSQPARDLLSHGPGMPCRPGRISRHGSCQRAEKRLVPSPFSVRRPEPAQRVDHRHCASCQKDMFAAVRQRGKSAML